MFLELAKARYSCRKFKDMPIPQDIIDKIIEAGMVAPTACNKQPQRILVINNDEALKKLRMCTLSHFNAPCAILICYDKHECYCRDYDSKTSGEIDSSIVTTHMMLEAYSLGIGSTWVMHFIPEAIITEFALNDNIVPVALLVLGYPHDDAKPYPGHFQSKNVNDIVKYNEF